MWSLNLVVPLVQYDNLFPVPGDELISPKCCSFRSARRENDPSSCNRSELSRRHLQSKIIQPYVRVTFRGRLRRSSWNELVVFAADVIVRESNRSQPPSSSYMVSNISDCVNGGDASFSRNVRNSPFFSQPALERLSVVVRQRRIVNLNLGDLRSDVLIICVSGE